MDNDPYKIIFNYFEKRTASDAIRLAYAMAHDYEGFWEKTLGSKNRQELMMEMMPFAIQILIASRTDVQS
jgi:hypothetical protein